ncbi:MAG: SUMF1/EgtB/PvdO family nonheme iron enzyme, partial [Planctomycetota bacterium]
MHKATHAAGTQREAVSVSEIRREAALACLAGVLVAWFAGHTYAAAPSQERSPPSTRSRTFHSVGRNADALSADRLTCLRRAIEDLQQTFGAKYVGGAEFLARLKKLEGGLVGPADSRRLPPALGAEFRTLQTEALLANPLLDFERLLVVKRKPTPGAYPFGQRLANDGEPLWYSQSAGADIGLPSNHECNSSLSRQSFDNEIATFSPRTPDEPIRTLYRPGDGGYVGEVDLHWDADRLLFTGSDATNWKVFEMRFDGAELRQVTQMPDDVDSYDACYLPDGRIVFGSSAPFQAVPCWHGLRQVTNLYIAESDGSSPRRLCYDQDHDLHPVVMPTGQVMYNRWDYTGINHIYLRQLMLMNPDGSGQRAIYGSSSWYPNSLYFPRPLSGDGNRIVSILSGYHGVHKMGQLVVLNFSEGWREAEGIVQRISGRGDPLAPAIHDDLVSRDWPKFLHPYPLSDKYFLVASWPNQKASWGIYLADVFDNVVLLREEPGHALIEPIPVHKRPRPPALADRVDLGSKEATVYLHDVYAGPGLADVPRGTVKDLRVVAYHFGYPHLAGPHLVGRAGPWEVMRVLGTVPVEEDGSAMFRVPANTPIALQPLDSGGKAVQLMRSWFTAMPGEAMSCVGCHENPTDAVSVHYKVAQRQTPHDISPWRGPARGFDFEREVQPVLDTYCVSCHSPTGGAKPDLRALAAFPDYAGQVLDETSYERLHPEMFKANGGRAKYTPAYDALIPYVRRVGIEDDVSLLTPAEYYADNSELLQMLRKGHHGVRLDPEAHDRLVTWIDLNAPCHGTWGDVFPIPEGMHQRRMALAALTGGRGEDPESVERLSRPLLKPVVPAPLPDLAPIELPNWPFDAAEARKQQDALGETRLRVGLGEGVVLELARIPAGEFVMGSGVGPEDERPPARVRIEQPFWMGVTEVSNQQFRQFDDRFDAGYYVKRHARADDKGLMLSEPDQPVVRVSWAQATGFCQWLTKRTGMRFTLPTEAQWEWACRAGSERAMADGTLDADSSGFANLADSSFARGFREDGKQVTGGVDHLLLEGADLAERRWNDGQIVTAPTGSYLPNPWGLHDMHGNAAEWTLSSYQSYPYRDDDGRNGRQMM